MSIPLYVFTGLAAIILASVAAFFSITGLGALYAAAFIPVVIMASSIEISKIAATLWLHRNYKKANKAVTSSLIALVIGAMFITSGGVYGFLTGGHSNQETPINEMELRLERYESRIESQQKIVKREQARLDQLDDVIDTLVEYDKISGEDGARAVRKNQQEERKAINTSIENAYNQIDELREEKLELEQELTQTEAKLGPVKYLAALFNANTDNAVIYFTLILVLLLDPFAILLVIATSISYQQHQELKNKKIKDDLTNKEFNEEKHDSSLKINFEELDVNQLTSLLENETIQNTIANDPNLLSLIEEKLKNTNKSKKENNNTKKEKDIKRRNNDDNEPEGWYGKGNPIPKIGK